MNGTSFLETNRIVTNGLSTIVLLSLNWLKCTPNINNFFVHIKSEVSRDLIFYLCSSFDIRCICEFTCLSSTEICWSHSHHDRNDDNDDDDNITNTTNSTKQQLVNVRKMSLLNFLVNN